MSNLNPMMQSDGGSLMRSSHAFFMTTRMVSIRLAKYQEKKQTVAEWGEEQAPTNDKDRFKDGEIVKGRVFFYDDSTKTLVLKLWSDEADKYTGIGVYCVHNVMLERIHVLQDLDMDDDKEAGVNGFTCSEDSYNKIEMDRKEKFFKEQVEKRKAELDAKYGALKRMDFIPGKK